MRSSSATSPLSRCCSCAARCARAGFLTGGGGAATWAFLFFRLRHSTTATTSAQAMATAATMAMIVQKRKGAKAPWPLLHGYGIVDVLPGGGVDRPALEQHR